MSQDTQADEKCNEGTDWESIARRMAAENLEGYVQHVRHELLSVVESIETGGELSESDLSRLRGSLSELDMIVTDTLVRLGDVPATEQRYIMEQSVVREAVDRQRSEIE